MRYQIALQNACRVSRSVWFLMVISPAKLFERYIFVSRYIALSLNWFRLVSGKPKAAATERNAGRTERARARRTAMNYGRSGNLGLLVYRLRKLILIT